MRRLQILLMAVMGCSTYVESSESTDATYQRTRTEPGRTFDLGVYAFCDGTDPAVNGACSGASVIVQRIEHINTGRGHMFCYFEEAPGAVLQADVWCSPTK
jgi:hypothetical protein